MKILFIFIVFICLHLGTGKNGKLLEKMMKLCRYFLKILSLSLTKIIMVVSFDLPSNATSGNLLP